MSRDVHASAAAPLTATCGVGAHAGRRQFLRRAALVSAATGTPFAANLLLAGAAAAQTASDHKALVCVFLDGGNDQSNLVVPASGAAYADYQRARPTLALPAASLLPIAPAGFSGPALGLHPALAPLKTLFDQNKLAVVANVGTLLAPVTKSQWNRGRPTVNVPFQLFSHSDQAAAWQTALPDRRSATGWLGRAGDLTADVFNPGSGVSISMSVGGQNVMLAGDRTVQYQLTTNGAVKVGSLTGLYGNAANGMILRRLMSDQRSHLFENELTRISARAVASEGVVTQALSAVSLTTAFPDTAIGRQLRMVARMIGARQGLNQRRQIFFVHMGGYDFHDNLLDDQNRLLGELAAALGAFQQAVDGLGVAPNVTTFTVSDFGRALQHNGRGSDHGWGSHQFVMGGAVRGGRVLGDWPTVALNGPEDAGQGRLIPSMAVDEYAATLVRWFGVSDGSIGTVLPYLGRFARRDIGLFA
jgi:uncharacterized protein (DUF1501 family)